MRSELDRLCERTPRVTITTTYGTAPEPTDRDWKPAHNWMVTLRRDGRQITVPFYGGELVGEPTAADVLSSLLSDTNGYDMARGFEDWAQEYGYDPDSRTAERLYRTVERQAGKVHVLLGVDYSTYAEAEH